MKFYCTKDFRVFISVRLHFLSGDLKQATNIAAGMVKTWGMTSRFKCRSFDTDAVTLDASFARLINVEVRKVFVHELQIKILLAPITRS